MARVDLTMAPGAVRAFLEEPNTGVLTTLTKAGWPHSAGMWFVQENEALLMWTYGKSQKTKNVERDPRVSFLVEQGQPYLDLRGVLVQGRAEIVRNAEEIARIGRLVYDRYVFPKNGVSADEGPHLEIERQSHKRVGLIIPFDKITSWDHSKALV